MENNNFETIAERKQKEIEKIEMELSLKNKEILEREEQIETEEEKIKREKEKEEIRSKVIHEYFKEFTGRKMSEKEYLQYLDEFEKSEKGYNLLKFCEDRNLLIKVDEEEENA